MGIREILEKVRFAELFNEVLWSAAFKASEHDPPRRQPYPYSRSIPRSKLSQEFPSDLQSSFFRTIRLLRAHHYCDDSNSEEIRFYLHAFNPLAVARVIVEEISNEADLRYLYMRSLRERHNLRLNSRTAETFSLFADAASRVLEKERRIGQLERRGTAVDLTGTLLASLRQAWSIRGLDAGAADSELAAFVQTCRVVNYFQPHHHPGKVLINTRRIDSEFLLSNLFGLSTSMSGFDDLFGGGGIMLTDGLGDQSGTGVDGRKVLVVGRYGSGKSLLSLQMAVEVARKGGAAWVMSLEQPAEECLYALAAVGQYPDRRSVRIETNPVDAALAMKEENDRGLLIFVDNIKNPYESFLESLTQNATLLAKYGHKYLLRLIVVDPINAVFRKRETLAELRDETLKSLDLVVKNNTNVWIVSEDEGEEELSFVFEQNIADTVIKLRNTRAHDYSMRFIEISKSRMQREQRGWHPISIKPEGGILVAPAPSAVAARIRPRSTLRTGQYVEFGVPGMEDILSRKGLAAGDVVIIRGPEGNLKTQLGQSFLFASDLLVEQIKRTTRPKSLLVAIGEDTDKVRVDLEQTLSRIPVALRRKTLNDILVLSIPKGYIQPGFVLQLVEKHLVEARRQGYMIDRVTVDDVRNWILSCPFLREDATFGDTLVELLRKYGVTSCFVCSEAPTDHDSALREMIISNADCEIRLLSHNFKGAAKSIVRVSKTSDMAHRRELFELSVRDNGIFVQPISSLLRLDNDGVIRPVTIRLFLHAETRGQQQYNERIRDAIQSTLSPATHLTEQSRVFLSSSASLGRSAAVDELQLVQLDEFQMPNVSGASDASIQLWPFSDDLWQDECWGGMLDVLETRVRRKGGSFIGLPFFCNIGMMAYRHAEISKEAADNWTLLAEQCDAWQKKNDDSQLFFDFPAGTDENYNCLFWEILLSRIESDRLRASDCALMRLLTTSEAIEAAIIMRSLARRAHLRKQSDSKEDPTLRDRVSTSSEALVWRHWYTTLNDMLAAVDEKTRRQITVALLPKKVCVAGEWFVAIPQYSAAPGNGLDLIRILTSTAAELDRMVRGVGLPTRARFYYAEDKEPTSGVLSPFFRLPKKEVGDRIQKAFRRSQFQCYSLLSGVLATHLKQILEVPDCSKDELREETGSILNSLVDTLRFVESRGTDSMCVSCGTHRSNINQSHLSEE